MDRIVVERTHHGRQIEWREVDLSEARRLISARRRNGFGWHIPSWQFDNDGATPESELQDKQSEAYRAVRMAS